MKPLKALTLFLLSFFVFATEIDDEEIIQNLEFYQAYEALEEEEDLEEYDLDEEVVENASESNFDLEEEV